MILMLTILALTLVAVGATRLGALWSQWWRQRRFVRACQEVYEKTSARRS